VKQLQAGNAEVPVVISADRSMKYEAVMNVMDALQKERIQRVGLPAEKEEKAEKERARKEREAQAQRLAQAEAKKREQQAKEKERAEEQRLAQLRQKNLERLMGQVSGTGANSTATAAQAAGPSAAYTGRLIAAIKPNIVFTDTLSGNPAAEVEVRTGPSGSIIARRLLRSSGHKEWDEAVLRAIDRTGTLPRDTDGRVPPTLTMVFRPQE
jgi:colicin import membrane protein